ncbi:MAG: peptide MFS transporter [Planctomycetales bacterium]|nr:peptide MFS transporter [Planctomycetales bacterium]
MNTLATRSVMGHKPGLFLLFFTEMWERFSYYGMRALLVLFLVSEHAAGGWAWTRDQALSLYGIYTGLVYFSPILGGLAADAILGSRRAVILGAFLMTCGHASMALESTAAFYTGLTLLILGNGFFKPNISSMVGQLYASEEDRKDSAYTIFYMGINAGAFLGILLCGYLGEKISWSYGFGLAGIFMCLGMIMFWLGQSILGEKVGNIENNKILSSTSAGDTEDASVVRDRLIVIAVLSFFTIFFWMAFEQAGGSMTIFAKDYTGRVLQGSHATMFTWANTALTIGPLIIVTYVLLRLVAVTYTQIAFSNISIIFSFVLIWACALWMLQKEWKMRAYEVSFASLKVDADGTTAMRTIQSDLSLTAGDEILLVDIESKQGDGKLRIIAPEQAESYTTEFKATVVEEKSNQIEVPASWFGILNSFFILTCAPFLGRIWASRFNPTAPVKFGIGLVLLGLGFGILVMGSAEIGEGQRTAAVSMWFLILAYLLHTLGELCVSPVGLSYVSKLAPAKMAGVMFGVWFLCTAIANYLAGATGSYIDAISERYGLTTFFLIYTCIPIAAGLVMIAMNRMLIRKMHGIS